MAILVQVEEVEIAHIGAMIVCKTKIEVSSARVKTAGNNMTSTSITRLTISASILPMM